jgi:hypothetical protein
MARATKKRFVGKRDMAYKLHEAELRISVLETALRQIAEKPTDDPEALEQIATTALEKADEAEPVA